ncbi:MAG: hypothetical protein HOP12_07020 [Candidatus Eisenbacteria bacterium]|uniref:ADP,ATP carrier protein n=1 Tax=Eiseniibacteriota bacterium TaxID=2212470 RepID=A0A849SPN4_UNCEI|nr:hypothetical protein [Candidatus Eisenbacteria bacterium]
MASQVASRAVRDTLFLSNFALASLPIMIVAASALAIVAAWLATRAAARLGAARFVTLAMLASAVLTIGEWGLTLARPALGAIALYLHVAAIGPLLISGFWSMLSERIEPRAARRSLARILAIGTLGGLAGGVLAERLTSLGGVAATFPALALAHAGCAWATWRFPPLPARVAKAPEPPSALGSREAMRRLIATPYLRNLALLVLGSAASAALLDFVFKAQVTDAWRGSHELMRVFSTFYAATALLTFAIQSLFARAALEHGGLARTIGSLPAAVVGGATVALVAPGAASAIAARGLELVMRGSLFRAGYELLYTPIPPAEKRATRALVDVACDRLGDAVGAGLILLVLGVAAGASMPVLLGLAVASSAAVLAVVSRVQRGYIASLEAGLRVGELRLDPLEVQDLTTRTTLSTMLPVALARSVEEAAGGAASHVRRLVDTLLDPATDVSIRRRIPRLLTDYPTPLAVEGLTGGLDDARFEVRYRCGVALARLIERDEHLRADSARILSAVRREAAVGHPVWESQRLLERLEEREESTFVDDFLRERAGRTLQHTFTLLSMVLPREPLRIAFRGLFAGDRMLRGTALEYLESVLPPDVREVLWPHLEPDRTPQRVDVEPSRDRDQILRDLMHANPSIEINLAELRAQQEPRPDAERP